MTHTTPFLLTLLTGVFLLTVAASSFADAAGAGRPTPAASFSAVLAAAPSSGSKSGARRAKVPKLLDIATFTGMEIQENRKRGDDAKLQSFFDALSEEERRVAKAKLEKIARLGKKNFLIYDHYPEWLSGLAASNMEAYTLLGRSRAGAFQEEMAAMYTLATKTIADDMDLNVRSPNVREDEKVFEPVRLVLPTKMSNDADEREFSEMHLAAQARVVIVVSGESLIAYEMESGRELWRELLQGMLLFCSAHGDSFMTVCLGISGKDSMRVVSAVDGKLLYAKYAQFEKQCYASADKRYTGLYFNEGSTQGKTGFVIFDMRTRRVAHITKEKAIKKAFKDLSLRRMETRWDSPRLPPSVFTLDFDADDNALFRAKGKSQLGFPILVPSSGKERPLKKSDMQLVSFVNIQGKLVEDSPVYATTVRDERWAGIPDRSRALHLFSLTKRKRVCTITHELFSEGVWIPYEVVPIDAGNDIFAVQCKNFLSKEQVLLKVDFKTGDVLSQVIPGKHYNNALTAFAVSRENKAAMCTVSGDCWLLDLNTGRIAKLCTLEKDAVAAACFSRDGKRLFLGSFKGKLLQSHDLRTVNALAENIRGIEKLCADDSGERLWVLRDPDASSGEASGGNSPLVLVTTASGLQQNCPLSLSTIVALDYDPRSGQAVALESVPEKRGAVVWEAGSIRFEPLRRSTQFGAPLEAVYASAGFDAASSHVIFQCVSGGMSLSRHLVGGLGQGTVFGQHLDSGKARIFRPVRVQFGASNSLSGAFFHESGRIAALTEHGGRFGASFTVYNLDTGSPLLRLKDRSKHPRGIIGGAFLKGKERVVTAGFDGVVRLWDISQAEGPKNMLSWHFLANGNFLVLGPDNRFDTPDIEALDGIHWVADVAPGRALPLECFMRDYYQPRLAEYLLQEKALPSLPDISSRNLFQAEVLIRKIMPSPGLADHVSVIVELRSREGDTVHGVRDLKLFRDGRMAAWHKGAENDGRIRLKDGKAFVVFDKIALPRSKKAVELKAYAFNDDKIRSRTAVAVHRYTPTRPATPRLHLLAIGVNDFDNPSWNLNYAFNDAKAFSEILPRYLRSAEKGVVRLLASGQDGYEAPTRNAIQQSLARLSGLHTGILSYDSPEVSGPDDIVVLSLATHGLTADGVFYLLPSDVPGTDRTISRELLEHAISAETLSEWMAGLDAGEVVLVIDACESGVVLGGEDFKPGPMGDKGLGQLAYDKAIRVLCATNGNNAALELDSLRHGILSYVLLKEGLEEGRARFGKNGQTSLRDWLVYGKERTAEFYAKLFARSGLGPTRGKVVRTPDAEQDGVSPGQEPFFFDAKGESATLSFESGDKTLP